MPKLIGILRSDDFPIMLCCLLYGAMDLVYFGLIVRYGWLG